MTDLEDFQYKLESFKARNQHISWQCFKDTYEFFRVVCPLRSTVRCSPSINICLKMLSALNITLRVKTSYQDIIAFFRQGREEKWGNGGGYLPYASSRSNTDLYCLHPSSSRNSFVKYKRLLCTSRKERNVGLDGKGCYRWWAGSS